jgi:dihydroflavonol-4-reductase
VSPIVAVTGATGFIGRHLAAHLAARGDTVRAIVRAESRRRPPDGVEIYQAPLEAGALRRAFAGAGVVVHLAGVVSTVRDEEFMAVNAEGSRAAAEAALDAGARFVLISSLAAAGPAPASAPRGEDDPPAPINAYGRSKLAGERAVHGVAGLHWTTLRPGVVYGPGDRALLPLFRFAARGLMPLVGRRDAAYSFVHVDDLVRAIAAAVDAGSGSQADGLTCFVAHPRAVTVDALLGAIRAAVRPKATVVPLPRAVLYPAAVLGDIVGGMIGRTLPINRRRYAEMYSEGFVCRVDRLREGLGIEATIDLPDGIAGTAAWYRDQGWL